MNFYDNTIQITVDYLYNELDDGNCFLENPEEWERCNSFEDSKQSVFKSINNILEYIDMEILNQNSNLNTSNRDLDSSLY
ncbi:hypothetical protein [Alkaliphilus sp. B6464]|uniref:hypothetical protein n=1 Tax=Alkaliphilus sp. B6464 TaxID=2731219 RepID=UPI001BA7483F|nr:hypothetical protein [Alkaliphilus sp. B6464]QUH18945.1 hypothetical protein HYG84_03025 [Alkaliphilus sp. B6464]